MSKKFFVHLAIFTLAFCLILSGCQSTPQQTAGTTQEPQLPTPFSNGPTTAPGVKGPTAAPSDSKNYSQQAVSETETVRYTLPTTPSVQVKQ
jgi:hypothetical protein